MAKTYKQLTRQADEEIAQMVAEKRMFEEAYDNPSGGDLI